MVKNRVQIPKAVRESVLHEFNYRCAICGMDNPHIHHIDENPSNNDIKNLISLCPNCHLIDEHDPTRSIGPEKLRFFREYKDPTVLKPQFHPLWARLTFLDLVQDSSDVDELEKKSEELIDFIASLEMGSFYSKQIGELVKRERPALWSFGAPGEDERNRAKELEYKQKYRDQVRSARNRIHALIVELLRFQKW